MDINALKKRLGEISNKNTKNKLIWKPSNGEQLVRLVPYKFQPENPFIELWFHYDFNGKNYLSPKSFDRPDPLVEFANKLRSSNDKEDYELSKKFYPKMRIYVPIVVRGEEDQGVRFWGFGKQAYQALLALIADDEYGDISDIKEGHDIKVTYIPMEESGKSFPETQIMARPKKSVVGDSKIIDSIKAEVAITEVFTESSYDDLKAALDKYLNPEEEEEEDTSEDAFTSDDSSTGESKKSKSVTEEKAAPKAEKTSVKNASSDFDELFGS